MKPEHWEADPLMEETEPWRGSYFARSPGGGAWASILIDMYHIDIYVNLYIYIYVYTHISYLFSLYIYIRYLCIYTYLNIVIYDKVYDT